MPVYISLLRGINVSGQRMIRMEALRNLCASMGWQKVTTYIQSGNLIYQTDEQAPSFLSNLLTLDIRHAFGFEVPVVTIRLNEMQEIISRNPFLPDKAAESKYLHVTFLSDVPEPRRVASVEDQDDNGDRCEIIGKAIYLYCPAAYHSTKFSNAYFEKKLLLTATTRNWKTTQTLLQLGEAI